MTLTQEVWATGTPTVELPNEAAKWGHQLSDYIEKLRFQAAIAVAKPQSNLQGDRRCLSHLILRPALVHVLTARVAGGVAAQKAKHK